MLCLNPCTFVENVRDTRLQNGDCSPQSNGMTESFVKTPKRDYLAFVELKDGDMALSELPNITERYNQKISSIGVRIPIAP